MSYIIFQHDSIDNAEISESAICAILSFNQIILIVTTGSVQVDVSNFLGKAFMLRSFNVGGTYAHVRKGGEIWLDKFDGTRKFLEDTSFAIVHGLAGKGISFRSAVHANMYLRHRNFKVSLKIRIFTHGAAKPLHFIKYVQNRYAAVGTLISFAKVR